MPQAPDPASALARRFSQADTEGFASFSLLDDDLDRTLWVLHVAAAQLDLTVLSPYEISVVLRDALKCDIPRQRVEGLLSGASGLVSKHRRNKRRAYQVMQPGIDRIEGTRDSVLFIEPEQALTRTRELQDLIGACSGVVKICDPYFAPRSLDLLTELKKARELRILTYNVDKQNVVKRDAQLLAKELGIPVQVRRAPDRRLHDRYIIDDQSMFVLGTSLNGIGSKQSIVVTVGQDLREVADGAFDRTWALATPL